MRIYIEIVAGRWAGKRGWYRPGRQERGVNTGCVLVRLPGNRFPHDAIAKRLVQLRELSDAELRCMVMT